MPTTTFADWYRAEHPRVLGALTALTGDTELAAEVTDEAFARALAHWARVSRMESPAGWTHRVALNTLRRRHRRRSTEARALASLDSRTGAGGPFAGHVAPALHPEVWAAVRALPEKQRVAIVLRCVADLPEAAIAETMRVSRGTVASNLSDARRSLAAQLGPAPSSPSFPSTATDPAVGPAVGPSIPGPADPAIAEVPR